jgi:hypothetical protein
MWRLSPLDLLKAILFLTKYGTYYDYNLHWTPYALYSSSFIITGFLMVFYVLLEGGREHRWIDLLPYIFLLMVLLKDGLILSQVDSVVTFLLASHIYTILELVTPSLLLITLDGLLIVLLAFLIPRLRGGRYSSQLVYWVYLFFGLIIIIGGTLSPQIKIPT